MAVVATWSSSAALVKAVVLPLVLALLAVAAATGSSSSAELQLEDGPAAVAKSGGRFSETPVGRKLLNVSLDLCGTGTAPDFSCKKKLPLAYNATCCTDPLGSKACWDVGLFYPDKCGSCNTTCKAGEVCCYGVCVNLITDKNNCGICGNKCKGNTTCKWSLCGYGS